MRDGHQILTKPTSEQSGQQNVPIINIDVNRLVGFRISRPASNRVGIADVKESLDWHDDTGHSIQCVNWSVCAGVMRGSGRGK
jgi:hypothetical protein